MSLSPFQWRYLFHYERSRSREYRSAARCVSDGMDPLLFNKTLYTIDAGEGPGHPRDFLGTCDRLRELLRKHRLGIRYRVDAVAERTGLQVGRVNFRVLQVLPKSSKIAGTPQTKQWAGIVEHLWPEARFAGSVACKPSSDHAFGAAVDYFATMDEMEAMHRTAITNADELGTRLSILKDDIWLAGPPWTNSARGHQAYTGIYHLHHHRSSRDGECGVWCSPGYGGCQ